MLTNGLAANAEELLGLNGQTKANPAVYVRRAPEAPPIAMMGVTFDNVNLPETLKQIEEMIAARKPRYIVTANVDFLVQARRDTELRRILNDAHMVLCDGKPLVWMSRLLGNRLPERVAGADLVPQLIRLAAQKKYRLFFLGATAEANTQAITNVRAQYSNVKIAGHFSPPFRPLPEMNHQEIIQNIRAANPDILFVAFGCPKAEKWMAAYYQSLGVPVVIGVGGTIDFLAGRVKRAPLWMQRAGGEWIYRMLQEPRRLCRRYLTDLCCFVPAMVAQYWRMTKTRASCACLHDSFRHAVLRPTWLRIRAPECLDADAVRHKNWTWNDVDSRHCLLDLAHVKFIDSTGVGLLLQLRKKIKASGRSLILLSPSHAVQQALKSMSVQNFFVTVMDAIKEPALIKRETADN